MKQRMQVAQPINDEPEIIQKAIEGEKQAFGLLYEKYANAIFKYLYFRLTSYEEAEDMTESVFLNAWEALPTFNKLGKGLNFRAWLYRIAHNLLVDFFRARRANIPLETTEELAAKTPSPEAIAEQNENDIKLSLALRQLDETPIQVITNRFIAGLDHKETALIMGLSEANVRVIQFRALNKLREILGDSHE